MGADGVRSRQCRRSTREAPGTPLHVLQAGERSGKRRESIEITPVVPETPEIRSDRPEALPRRLEAGALVRALRGAGVVEQIHGGEQLDAPRRQDPYVVVNPPDVPAGRGGRSVTTRKKTAFSTRVRTRVPVEAERSSSQTPEYSPTGGRLPNASSQAPPTRQSVRSYTRRASAGRRVGSWSTGTCGTFCPTGISSAT